MIVNINGLTTIKIYLSLNNHFVQIKDQIIIGNFEKFRFNHNLVSFGFLDLVWEQLSGGVRRVQPDVALLVDACLLELNVRAIEPVPEAQPSVAGVESGKIFEL